MAAMHPPCRPWLRALSILCTVVLAFGLLWLLGLFIYRP